MDDRMRFAVEMHEMALSRAFERTLADLEEGEVEWPAAREQQYRADRPAPVYRGAVASRLPRTRHGDAVPSVARTAARDRRGADRFHREPRGADPLPPSVSRGASGDERETAPGANGIGLWGVFSNPNLGIRSRIDVYAKSTSPQSSSTSTSRNPGRRTRYRRSHRTRRSKHLRERHSR